MPAERASHERRVRVMGTTAHVVCTGGSADLLDEAVTFLHAAEARWSRFRPDSELSRCNRASGRLTVVSPETYTVVRAAIDAWAATDGAFDPTVHDALVELGYDRDFAAVAAAGAAPRPRRTPGCGAIELHPARSGRLSSSSQWPWGGTLRLPPGVHLDLGGIAKGHTADLLAARLVDRGAAGACVNIGGDVRVTGEPPAEHPWVIALDAGPGLPELPRLAIGAGAVCTSSTRRRRWCAAGRDVHHLIDPRSGRSVSTGIATVSVIGRTAAQAEVLTKAFMVRGIATGCALLESLGAAAVLVTDGGDVIEAGNVRELHA